MTTITSEPRHYAAEEVFATAAAYFEGDELAATSWMNKYAMRDRQGRYLESTPDDMHRRLAREFARVEAASSRPPASAEEGRAWSAYGRTRATLDEDAIYELFRGFRTVIPQGCVEASLGNPHTYASLSNCVVLPPVHDSYGGVLYTDQQGVQLHKRRSGVGIDLSTLRPAGSRVANATGTTSGPVTFAERFSNSKREIAPNGRRGSLMLTLDCTHPDVAGFIALKRTLSRVTGANVSVKITDDFMRAMVADAQFLLRWPPDTDSPEVVKPVRARELWDEIITGAWQAGEPGVLFWDRHHGYSPSSPYPEYRNLSTNPCAEIAMQGGDSCRLMTLNVYDFVRGPFTPHAELDEDRLYRVAYEAMRLNDDLVDLELECIERILEKIETDPEPDAVKAVERDLWQTLAHHGRRGRRAGLGITGLADAVAALGVRYGGPDSLRVIERIMRTKCRGEFDASIDMAIERGPFAGFDPRVEATSAFVDMLAVEFPDLHARMMRWGRRNVSLSTVPPAGTLSLLAGTSSGVEPVFALRHTRRRRVKHDDPRATAHFTDSAGDTWEEFEVRHPKFEAWQRIAGEVAASRSPYAGATAFEIPWRERVAIQVVVQKYTTHSVSSTVNLPRETPRETVAEILREAWEQGLKGVTIYREGSRSGVLVPAAEDPAAEDPAADEPAAEGGACPVC